MKQLNNNNNTEKISFSSTKMYTIRFWNGEELKLEPSSSEKLEDVVRSHLSDYTIPIQCTDLSSAKFIPWETPTTQLSSKTLLIKSHIYRSLVQTDLNDSTVERQSSMTTDSSLTNNNLEIIYQSITNNFKPFIEIRDKNVDDTKPPIRKRNRKISKAIFEIHRNKLSSTFNYPTNNNMKKMDRRSAPPLDTTSHALKNWFDFYKKSHCLNPSFLSDHIISECLRELNPNLLGKLLPKQLKIFDETITPITPITTTTTSLNTLITREETTLHKSNSPLLVENNQQFSSQDLANLFFIEESWEQIVKTSSKMTRQEQKKQSAIWEFIYTEAKYLKYLRTIIDVSCTNEIHSIVFIHLIFNE
ncbi:unnamed protein product [Schistosoma turkestanicum]|nr:unnamed protein product [Schistosoma turkestanicum]